MVDTKLEAVEAFTVHLSEPAGGDDQQNADGTGRQSRMIMPRRRLRLGGEMM